MYERTRSPSSGFHATNTSRTARMASDFGPRKTMFILVVVVGCFAVLWPKVFYPMLVGSANQHMKPSPIDKTTGCCDVFSETDINTIKIMSELCSDIIQQSSEKPLTGKEIVIKCKTEIQQTCGIDVSAMLQEQVRLGRSVKQILNEIRSMNGSLCLKYHYGVAPWRLGVPHRITVNLATNIKQERPPHLRPEVVHPAFRERGSAIPRPSIGPPAKPKIVEGRPSRIPGMRPTLGGAGHVVPPSQKTGSSMSVIMPIYTIGIVIFFTYTLMKLIFKKQPSGVGGSLYPPVEPDSRFRKEVFESERCKYTPRLSRDPTGKIVVNAVSALLDEVDEEIEARRKANAVANQAKNTFDHNLANGNLANGSVPKQQDQEQTSVKILGMETTASCEGGEKWNKPVEPVIPVPHPVEPQVPPQEIYLEGALPAQSQILVAESAVVTEAAPSETNSDPAVVLAGKMTLSVISLDSIHDSEKAAEALAEIESDIIELNGETENIEEDGIEESKYTTASSATAAENEISDDEGTDNEGVEEDVEVINELELEMNDIPDQNGIELLEQLQYENGEEIEEEEIDEEIEEIELEEEEIEEEEEEEEELEEIEVEVDEEIEEILPENKEAIVLENKEEKAVDNEEEIVVESNEKIAMENKEEITVENKEEPTPAVQFKEEIAMENKEEILVEKKDDIVSDNLKEVIIEEKEQITTDDKEEVSDGKKVETVVETKEEVAVDNTEELVDKNKEQIADETNKQTQEITIENKEEIAITNNENTPINNEGIGTEVNKQNGEE